MSSTGSPLETVREYFHREHPATRDNFGDGDSLLAAGILDSLAIVKLLAFVEEAFGIEISDAEFDPDHFESIEAIVKLVESKRGG